MRKTQHFVGKILPFSVAGLLLFAVSVFGVLANPPETVYADGDPHTVTLAYDEESNGSMSFDAAAGSEDPAVKSMQFKPGEKVGVTFAPNDGYHCLTPEVTYMGVIAESDEEQTIGEIGLAIDEGSALDNHIVFTMPETDVSVNVDFEAGNVELDVPEESLVPDAQEVISNSLGLEDREPSIADSIASFFGNEVDLSALNKTDRTMQVVETFVDSSNLPPEGLTIDSLFANQEYFETCYVTSTRTSISLYTTDNPDDEWAYAYLGSSFTKGIPILDWAAALNNSYAMLLDEEHGVQVDTETGIVRINKNFVESDNPIDVLGPLVQVLVSFDFNSDNLGGNTVPVDVVIDSNRPDVQVPSNVFTTAVSPFNPVLTIPVVSAEDAAKLTLSDFEILLDSNETLLDLADTAEAENGIDFDEDALSPADSEYDEGNPVGISGASYYYDNNTGELSFSVLPININKITVKIKPQSVVGLIYSSFFSLPKAEAVSAPTDIYHKDGAKDMTSLRGCKLTACSGSDFDGWSRVASYKAIIVHSGFKDNDHGETDIKGLPMIQYWKNALQSTSNDMYANPYGISNNGMAVQIYGTSNNLDYINEHMGRDLSAWWGNTTGFGSALTGDPNNGDYSLVTQDGRPSASDADPATGKKGTPGSVLCAFTLPGFDPSRVAGGNNTIVNGVDFEGAGQTVAATCNHVTVSSGESGSVGFTDIPVLPGYYSQGSNVYLRPLAHGDDYVVLGFVTSTIGSQEGAAIYKLDIDGKVPIRIQKVDANGNQINPAVGFKVMVGTGNLSAASAPTIPGCQTTQTVVSGDPSTAYFDGYINYDGSFVDGGSFASAYVFRVNGISGDIMVPRGKTLTLIEVGLDGDPNDAPTGYLFDALDDGTRIHQVVVTPTAGNAVVTYKVRNPKPPKIRVNKQLLDGVSIPSGYDSYYGNLSDATFKLYVDKDQSDPSREVAFADDAAFRTRLDKGIMGPTVAGGAVEPQWSNSASDATEFHVNDDVIYVCYPNMPGKKYEWTRQGFSGWYIVEEVNVPKGMLPPHDENGQRIYYRFRITKDLLTGNDKNGKPCGPDNVNNSDERVIYNDILRPVEITKTGDLTPEGQALGFTLAGAEIRVFMDETQSAASGGTDDVYGALGQLNSPAKGVKDVMSLDAGAYSQLNFEDLTSFFAEATLGRVTDELKMVELTYDPSDVMVLTSDADGKFPVFFVPPAGYFPDYKGYLDMEEVKAPNGFEIPFKWIEKTIKILYPQIDSPVEATPAAVIKDTLVNYDIPYWLSTKDIPARYRKQGFDANGNPLDSCYGSYDGAKFRILVDKNQGRDNIKSVDNYECGTPDFGLGVSTGVRDGRPQTLTTNPAEFAVFDTTNLPEKWFMPAAGRQAPEVYGGPFEGWYVIDEIQTPKGFSWPHDLKGNKVYPRFQLEDTSSTFSLEIFNEPHPYYQLEKVFDDGYKSFVKDDDSHYSTTMVGAQFKIYADPTQDSYTLDTYNGPDDPSELYSASGSKSVKTPSGRDVLATTSDPSRFSVALLDPTSGAMTSDLSQAAVIDIDSNGKSNYQGLDHFHLLPAFSPDYSTYTEDLRVSGAQTAWEPYGVSASNQWTWPRNSDGRFYGWYVLDEVNAPDGFMVPHDLDGNKVYPRFLVATGAWPDPDAVLEGPGEMTGHEGTFVVADEPITITKLDKEQDSGYNSLIDTSDSHYAQNLDGAEFVVWADPTQDKIAFADGSIEEEAPGVSPLEGHTTFSLESIKNAPNSKTVMTPSGRQVLTTKTDPSQFKLALVDPSTGRMSTDSQAKITINGGVSDHFHLYPAFSPDSDNPNTYVDWKWPEADDHRFYGWYVLDEVKTPTGFMVPHDMDGNKLYLRFVVASSADLGEDNPLKTLENPEDITGYNSSIKVYDQPILTGDLTKATEDNYQDTISGKNNPDTASGEDDYSSDLSGAQFVIWADPSQDAIDFANVDKDVNAPAGWVTEKDGAVTLNGDASFSLESVKKAANSKTVMTPSGHQVLATKTDHGKFKLALADPNTGTMSDSVQAKITIGEGGKSPHFHLFPAFSPDKDNAGGGVDWQWPAAADGRFYGWYVLDETTAPKGFMLPHDMDGNKLYPRFLMAASSHYDAETARKTLVNPEDVTGYNPTITVFNQPLLTEDLTKLYDKDSFENLVKDPDKPDEYDEHYTTTGEGAQFIVWADPTQDKIDFANTPKTQVDGAVTLDGDASFSLESAKAAPGSKTVITAPGTEPEGRKVLATNSNPSDFELALLNTSDGTMGKVDRSSAPTITIDANGKSPHFHLYPAFSPDSTNTGMGPNWAWPKASDGRFYGWYVLEEVVAPQGFMVPHDVTGTKIYPRFLVAADAATMSAKDTLDTPDTITGHNATINVYDEPIGSFDLVKDFNHEAYDTMVNYDDGCPDHQGTDYGTSSTTSRLAGARFNIYADNYQGANAADGEHPNLVTVDEGILYKDSTDGWTGGKSTTSGWKVYAGQKNTKFALIDPYTGQLGKTAIYDADSKNSPESFDDGILEVGTDGHLTTHVHLLGDGAPDMEKVYVKKPWGSEDGYPMVEDLATKIHSAYTTADGTSDTFHGWYVIEEVERPKGFVWPHTPDGQIVYPRFQVTSKSTAKVGFFEGEGGLGNFFDIPIPMVELFKRYKDDYSEMITGEPSPSESAIGGYATKEVECTDCSGTGFTDDGQSVPCEVCGGDGKKEVVNTTYTLDGAEIQFYVDQYQTDTTELKSGLTDGMDDEGQPKEDKTPYGTPNMNLGLVNPDSGRLGKATNAGVEGAAPEKNNGIYTFTTKENGTIRTHLLPQGTPDTVFTTDEKLTGVSSSNGESEFKLPRESGKFEGWYVIAEITPPEGFTWPHNTEGERMYPRFQVKMTDIYEHNAESESVTPRRSIPLTFYNEPLLHIDVDKVNNQQYQAVVRADENGKPTNKNYTLKDAKIRLFPDLDQKSTVEDRPNGMPDYRYAFSMQDQQENIQNKYPYNNYKNVAARDDDGNYKFITDADGNKVGIELDPEFNEKTIDGMTDALGNPEYYIHRYTTDKNGKFDGYIPCSEGAIKGYENYNPLLGNNASENDGAAKQTFNGYYVVDEVIAPIGYLLPHTLSGDESQVQPGQQLYPRFQVTDQRARENDRQQTVTEDPARVFFTVMKVDPTMLRTDITPESTPGHNGDNIVFDPNTNYPIKQVEGYMAGAVYALTTSNDGEVFYGLTSREGEVTFLSKEFKPFLDMLTEVANVPETAVSSMTQQAQELRNEYLALLKKEYETPQPTGTETITPFVKDLIALGDEYGYKFGTADVPLGDFTIREVMNPDGYEMSQDVIKSTITDKDLGDSVKDLGDLYLHPNGATWFKDHQYSNYNRTDINFDNTELYRKETPTSFDFALRKVRPTNYGDTSLYGENEKDENGNIKTLPLKTQLEKLLADLANIDYSKYDATTGEALKTAIEDATKTFNDQQSDDSDYTIAIQDVLAKRNVLKDLEGNKADIADTTTTQVGIPGIKFAIYRLNSDDQLYISGTQDPARSDKMELINGDRVGTIVTGSDGYVTTQIHEKASKFTQSNDYEVYDRNGNRVDRNLSEACPDCGGKGTTGDETPIPCETCQGKGEIQEMVDCTVCSGTGFTDEGKIQTCEACEGTGKVVATEEVDCTTCSGTGFTDEEKQVPCEVCGGDGKVDQPKAATPCADCDGTGNQGSVAAPKCATCNGSGYVANSRIWLGDGIPATDGGGTDDEGNAVDAAAIIGSLPYTEYGYLIRELEDNLPGELKLAADIRVRPSDQSTAHDGDYPAWNMDIYNNPVTVLRFIKTDARTQKTVPAAGFTFELYKADSPEDKNIDGKEPIVQVYQADHPDVVSGKVKAGKAYQWTTDATGSVTMPAPLANGYYIIHEVSTGDTINPPYIITPNVNFKFESNHGLVEVLEAPFANNVAHGHIDFQKVDAETGEPLAGVTFKVKAAEDIYSGDGTIVVAKGSYVACVDDGTGTDLTMVSDENGMVHCCDPAERHENGCLPIDATDGVSEFELVETHAVDGYNIIEPNKAIPFTVTYINDDPDNKDLNAVLGTAAAAVENDAPADTPDTPDVPETGEPGSEDTPVTPDTPETDPSGDEDTPADPNTGEDQEQDAQTPAMASETKAGDGVADEGAPEGSGDEDSEDQSKDPADTPEENPDGGSEDAGKGEAQPEPQPEPAPRPETDNIVVVHNPDAVMAATIETADGYAEYRSDDKVSDQNPMGNVVPNEKLRIPVIKGYVGDEAVVLPEASYMVWNADEEMASPDGVSEERYAANIIVSDGAGSVALRPHTGSGGLVTSRYDNQGFISLASETAVEGNYRLGTDQSLAVNPSTYQVMYHPVTVGVDGQVTQGQTQILGDLTVHAGDAVVLSPAEDGTLDVQTTSVEDLPVITLSKPLDGVENTYQVLLARGEYDVLVGGMVVNPESPLVIDKSNVTYWTNSLEVADGTRTPLGRWVRVLLPASANIQVQTTTGEDGVLEFVGLGIWDRITTYHFAEIDPPKGYTIDHAIYTITTNTENEPVLVPESSEASAISADGVAVASNGVMAQVAVDDGTSTVANDAGTLVVQSDLKSAKVLDDKTKVKISKKDMTTSEEIPGARLRLRDKDGNLIEEWYSTTEPHEIEGLKPGKYTLEEVIPPRTHETAETVTFEVKDDGTIEPVEMFDREIEIDAVIDKRQEIANPIADDTLANGDNAAQAKVQENKEGLYDYSLDYESRSNTYCDEFTVEDDLDMAKKGYAYLEGITTAQGGQDLNGLMNVWYKTNKDDEAIAAGKGASPDGSVNATIDDQAIQTNPWLAPSDYTSKLNEDGSALDNKEVLEWVGDDLRVIDYNGWHVWASNVPTYEATDLKVSDLKLADGEYITGFRFEYGRVEAGFTTREDRWEDPDIKDVHDDVDDVIAENNGSFTVNGVSHNYAPAKIHMRLTKAYDGTKVIQNSARVDAYRNGGHLPSDGENSKYGHSLEGHDSDTVVQMPMPGTPVISGKLDKRQEIADPVADKTEANGDGKNTANTKVSPEGIYKYSLDFINTSDTWVDEFTVTDSLDAVKARLSNLVSITTPMAHDDYDGLVNVWYKLSTSNETDAPDSEANQTIDDGHENPGMERQLSYGGWKLWKQGISLASPETLNVSDLNIPEGDYITDVRFEFGRVEVGFTSRQGDWDRVGLKDVHDDVDNVATENEAGYAPAHITCQVTPAYVEGKPLDNSAVLDIYRTLDGTVLSDHDADAVTQTPKYVPLIVPSGTPTSDSTTYKMTSLAETGIPGLIIGFGIIGAATGLTYTVRKIQQRRNKE